MLAAGYLTARLYGKLAGFNQVFISQTSLKLL